MAGSEDAEGARMRRAGILARIAGEQRGAALPIAVSVLLIVIMLTGVAVAYSVRSVDRSNFDRRAARALAAADAGLDVARYRMNKALLGGQVTGLIGLVNGTVKQLRCTQIGVAAAGLVRVGLQQGAGWCDAGGWEPVDAESGLIAENSPTCDAHVGASFRYFLRLDVGADVIVGSDGVINNDPIAWDVISAGCANGRTAVVRGRMPVDLSGATSAGGFLQLFKLEDYEQCGGLNFDPALPAATCS
jgi:type II secretory pathway pseudopilin PulG